MPTQPLPLSLSLVPSASANPVSPVAPPNGGPPHAQTLPYRDDHFGSGRRDSKYDRFDGPERARDRDDYNDESREFRGERGDFRGRYNRGSFRGGRGAGRGRWDDREQYSDRGRERNWESPTAGRYSRSRSPQRNKYAGRRDARPYSPPRRPSISHATGAPSLPNHSSTTESGKDEFGRDIRPESPDQEPPSHITHSRPTMASASVPGPSSVASIDDGSEHPTDRSSALGQTASTSTAPTSSPTDSAQNDVGLDAFDITTFNPTEASSWEALGKAWTATHGYAPSQEELMQLVMGNMMAVANQYEMQMQQQPQQQGIQTWTSDDEPQNWNRGQTSRGRGRGSFTHGNSRGGGQWGHSGDRREDDRGTDAVTLGGGDDNDVNMSGYNGGYEGGWGDDQQQYGGNWSGGGADQDYASQRDRNDEGPGGRMQKVGGKWVFVRPGGTTAAVS